MFFKTLFLTASAAALFAGSALADGGPAPETSPPPPPPTPVPYEPPPVVEEVPAIWYVDLHGGSVWLNDLEFSTVGSLLRTDLRNGWAAGGAIGYRYENGWRTEIEGTYRTNKGDFWALNDPLFGDVIIGPAKVSSLNIMMNVLYDFNSGGWVSPYLGAGIGSTRVTVDQVPLGGLIASDSNWAFSYQFIGGFSVPIPHTAMEFFADYRYLATAGLNIDFNGAMQDYNQYEGHTAMGGIRFNF